MTNELGLKWGTLKYWNFDSVECQDIIAAIHNTGPRSMSAMLQEDTDEGKELLCKLVDAVFRVGGEVWNDWHGTRYTDPEDAKKYIMEYGK